MENVLVNVKKNVLEDPKRSEGKDLTETTEIRRRTQVQLVFRRLLKNPVSVICIAILILLFLVAIFGPMLSRYSYEEMDLPSKLQTPSLAHLCGTDEMGRDIFSRILYGTRNSLLIGFVSTAAAFVIGVPLGIIAGYRGRIADNSIMRAFDIIESIPGMLLAIAISAALGIGMENCIIALAIGRIGGFVRMARASSLNVVDMEYIQAAKAMNVRTGTILRRHVLPNAIAPLIVQATLSVSICVISSAGLSFIGLGVQAPEAEWGCMLAAGRTFMRNYPHVFFAPLIAIMILVLALNLLGDGLRDALDPTLKD